MLRIHSVSLLSFSLHVPCPSLNAKRHHVGVLYLNHPICGPPLIKPNISSHMTSLYIYHWINGINSLVYYHELERDLADGTFQSSRGKLKVNQWKWDHVHKFYVHWKLIYLSYWHCRSCWSGVPSWKDHAWISIASSWPLSDNQQLQPMGPDFVGMLGIIWWISFVGNLHLD